MNESSAEPRRRFSEFYATEHDARGYTRTAIVCNLAAYAHLLLAAAHWVPGWTLALVVPVLVPRWMIAVHELFHLRSEREVDGFTRLLPFVFTPLALGYREQLGTHRGHHRHMAVPEDPEYYQLNSGIARGLFNAFTAPEQMWFRWVAERGIDAPLVRDTTIRLALFVALVAVAGTTFLWYLVPARIAFGASYFTFFYALHRRGPEYGVYPLALPGPIARVARLLLGRVVVEATVHHDVHHAEPRIAARHLALCRESAISG